MNKEKSQNKNTKGILNKIKIRIPKYSKESEAHFKRVGELIVKSLNKSAK